MDNVYELLDKLNIDYKMIEHKAVFNIEEINQLKLDIEGIGCKNLFLTDHHNNYYLYVIKDDKKADLKILQEILDVKRLSFASTSCLYERLKLTPCSVSPIGIINDNGSVILLLDKELNNSKILVHPNINTRTLSMEYNDLLKIIRYYKNKYIEI